MENYIPKIRFKGTYDENGKWVEFTHPWEQRKLGEMVIDHNAGIYISKEDYGEGTNVIGVGNIYDRDIFDGEIYRLGPVNDDKFILEENDIIYGESSLVPEGIARTVCVGKNGAGSAFAWHTRRVKLDKNIVNSHVATLELNYLHEIRKYLVSVSTQTALTGMTTEGYFGATLTLPSVEEQQVISDYFKNIDHLITLHQRKCDLYQQAKQSMMEKLFSNNVDWEEKQLGKILIRNPKSNIGVHETQQMKSGDIQYFTSGEKIFYINDFLVKGENIFVNDGGVADIKYYNGKANYSDHILSLKNIDNSICLQFVYQSLLSKIKIINDKLFHGLGLKNLSKKDFMNFIISIPDIEEQIKIANMLSKYDELIAISKNQLNTLQTLKKGLLQQMFV